MRENIIPTHKQSKALSEAGLRVTGQRALILEAIKQSNGHVDADEIYRQVRQKEPRLSLSTVYRSLQRLKEKGLIEELHLTEDHHHYEFKPSKEHQHLVCLECGRVVEFNYPLIDKIARKIATDAGFSISRAELNLAGYCRECRGKSDQT